MNRVLRIAILVFCGWLLCSVAIVSLARELSSEDYLLIISSNMRDNDQALYLMTPDGTPLKKLTAIPGGETVIDHSPDGKWLLIRSDVNGSYYSLNIANQSVHKITETFGRFIAMSPNSQWAYFTRCPKARPYEDPIYRIALADGEQQEIYHHPDSVYEIQISITPNADWMYLLTHNLTRIHIASETVEALPFETLQGAYNRIIGWSADMDWLYVKTENSDNTIVYRIHANGQDRQQVLITGGRVSSVHSSPDGLWVLLTFRTNRSRDFYRLSLDSSVPPLLVRGRNFEGWSADGSAALITRENENGVDYLCQMELETGDCAVLVENVSGVITWSPDRDQILYTNQDLNNQMHYFLVGVDGTNRHEVAYGNEVSFRDWSPDGEWLYFDDRNTENSMLFRINATTGRRETLCRTQ